MTGCTVPGALLRPPGTHSRASCRRLLPGPDRLRRPARPADRPVIETHVTQTLTDGTIRHGQWRLLTRLLGPALHPATELVTLYHERRQAETTFSIKATLLDGRALRSRSLLGIDQEVQALLTTYQAPIRTATDSACTRPDLDMDRMSCTVLLSIAADAVVTATGIQPPTDPADLLGTIGRAALGALHPPTPTSRQSPHAQEPHKQVRPDRRTTPQDQPELHHPQRHHVLRVRACE